MENKNEITEQTIARIIEEDNAHLHQVYGDWVNTARTPDGFSIHVALEGVDVEATLEKMDADPNIPTNDNTLVDMLTKLRDSLANNTFIPKSKI